MKFEEILHHLRAGRLATCMSLGDAHLSMKESGRIACNGKRWSPTMAALTATDWQLVPEAPSSAGEALHAVVTPHIQWSDTDKKRKAEYEGWAQAVIAWHTQQTIGQRGSEGEEPRIVPPSPPADAPIEPGTLRGEDSSPFKPESLTELEKRGYERVNREAPEVARRNCVPGPDAPEVAPLQRSLGQIAYEARQARRAMLGAGYRLSWCYVGDDTAAEEEVAAQAVRAEVLREEHRELTDEEIRSVNGAYEDAYDAGETWGDRFRAAVRKADELRANR